MTYKSFGYAIQGKAIPATTVLIEFSTKFKDGATINQSNLVSENKIIIPDFKHADAYFRHYVRRLSHVRISRVM